MDLEEEPVGPDTEPGLTGGVGTIVAPGGPSGGRWFEVLVDDTGVGGPVSAGELVVDLLARGAFPVVAATKAGIDVNVLRATLREGRDVGNRWARAQAAIEKGLGPGDEDWPLEDDEWPLARSEEAVLEFSRAVGQAKATDEVERGEALRRIGMGEVRRTVTTTKYEITDEGGEEKRKPLEVVERVEELPPDGPLLLKQMQVLYGERWTAVDRQETTVSGTIEHKIADPKEVVDRMRARLEEAEARAATKEPVIEAGVVTDETGVVDVVPAPVGEPVVDVAVPPETEPVDGPSTGV